MVVTRSGRPTSSSGAENGNEDDGARRIKTRSTARVSNDIPFSRQKSKRAANSEGQSSEGRKKRRKNKNTPPRQKRQRAKIPGPFHPNDSESRDDGRSREMDIEERNGERSVPDLDQQGGDAQGGDNVEPDPAPSVTPEPNDVQRVDPATLESGAGREGNATWDSAEKSDTGGDDGAQEAANCDEEHPPLQEGTCEPSNDLSPPETGLNTVEEGGSHHVLYDEISYQDMCGKNRSFSTELASFIVPFPETTPPLSLIHFVALYIIRNEARRIFPKEVPVSWLTDFFVSGWIQRSTDLHGQEDGSTQSFPLTEHDRPSLIPLVKKRFFLFPFFEGTKYSLVAIEGLGRLIDLLQSLVELEASVSKTTELVNDSSTLLQRINRFDKALHMKSIQETVIYHIDWPGSMHEIYRPSIQNFLVHLCLYLVDDLKESCSVEALTEFIHQHVHLHPKYIPDPPKNDHDSAWKVIQYVTIMIQDTGFNPETGKLTLCERDKLLNGSLKISLHDDLRILRNVACMAISNMQTAKENPQINPYPGLWGGVFRSLTRDISEPLLISSKINLSNCLPVVLEFSLKALDDFVNHSKNRLEQELRSEGFGEDFELQDLTDEMKGSLWLAALREKACLELIPQFETFVRITRPGKKAKERLARFWKSVFDHVMTLPPYREASNIFSAMRKFPDSVSVCLGLEYLHSKEHRLFFYQAATPNLRQGERPWKLFDHGSKNFSRTSHWFERGAWGRMHEAGVILFAITETIMRCVVSRELNTETELVSLLKATRLEKEEFLSSILTCPVHLRDVVHHARKQRESLDKYKKRVIHRIEDAAEAAKITLACASDAFKRALVPFGSAYGVKRGVKGLNVALCKLRAMPDNMLDLLWQNLTGIIKETLVNRQKKGEFSFDGGDQLGMEVEAQLIRLFRMMNTIFVNTADTLLKDTFLASRERLKSDVLSFKSSEGEGKRFRKLQAIPSFKLWNFVDARYSSGYMSSAAMAVPSVTEAAVEIGTANSVQTAEAQSDLSPLQALTIQGIPSSVNIMAFMKRDSLAVIPDVTLAMQTDPIPYVNLSKADLSWGLVTALGCILQKVPGHTRTYSCSNSRRLSCSPSTQPSNACIDLTTKMAQHVFETWADGYGIESLESQSVFTRFDALISSALQITSSSEFWCRPSFDASLCHQRELRYENLDERAAFLGYESVIATEDGPFEATKWRGVVAKAQIQKLPYPIRRMHVTTPSDGDRTRQNKVNAVDFLNLSTFDLGTPEVFKVDLRYLLQTPDFCGQRLHEKNGELSFQPGDVFWFSMMISGPISRKSFTGEDGYSGTHLGVMMEPAKTVFDNAQGTWDQDPAQSVAKEQVAAILFLPQEGNRHDETGFGRLLAKMAYDLRVVLMSPGNKTIHLIPTGINIHNELLTYQVTFRRSHFLPRAINLATIHPRLLQMHTQFVLTTVHRHCTSLDRRKGLSSGESQQQRCEGMRQGICHMLEELYPRLNPEQLNAIALPLLWARVVEENFFTEAGELASWITRHFSSVLKERDMNYLGANLFLVRGPPGTGKSYVITALIDAATQHKDRGDAQKVLPNMVKRVMVVTHTNTAVDDILVKVAKARNYAEGCLVRVGVRGKNHRTARYTVSAILDRIKAKRRAENERRRSRDHVLAHVTESDIIENASIVFSTFGSLQRSEFALSTKPFDMLIMEEAGKLHEGDLMSGVALVTGMKKTPKTASPFPIIAVGDELQLPPHSRVDPNLSVPRLCPASLFDRYVKKCEKVPGIFDFNYPVTLVTQHRAHRAIADIHSHFAYKGVIQTGARESFQRWTDDEMDRRISESRFKFRTVSIVSYRGSIHGDVRGRPNTGGNTNTIECDLILNICEDWFYYSQKFAKRITVLSPYKGQVAKIQDRLRKRSEHHQFRGLSSVEVHTVDSSQGIESDIVIVSLVRTHRSQRQAFLDNPNRINVMISRAKERLIIIGARDEMCAISPNWNRFYSIVDALAREELASCETVAISEEENEKTQRVLNYGFYNIMSSSSISGPEDSYT